MIRLGAADWHRAMWRLLWPLNVLSRFGTNGYKRLHWLGSNLQRWADTQSPRQFRPQWSPWQQPVFHPFHLKLAKAVISAPVLIHISNYVQTVDDRCCQKNYKKIQSTHWHEHLWSLFLERSVTRRGKCIYTVWIQPFPLLPEKLFKTRKAVSKLLMDVLFAVTWIMGRQAWHMYLSCSVHWVMQAVMLHSHHLFPFSQFSSYLLTLTWCQQALPWTRTGWFILSMAPQFERWTRTESSPLSWDPTTSHLRDRWPVTTVWTSVRWIIYTKVPDNCISSPQSIYSLKTWHVYIRNSIRNTSFIPENGSLG